MKHLLIVSLAFGALGLTTAAAADTCKAGEQHRYQAKSAEGETITMYVTCIYDSELGKNVWITTAYNPHGRSDG